MLDARTHSSNLAELPGLLEHLQLDPRKPEKLDRRGEPTWARADDCDLEFRGCHCGM
jgi:hypothetical protein